MWLFLNDSRDETAFNMNSGMCGMSGANKIDPYRYHRGQLISAKDRVLENITKQYLDEYVNDKGRGGNNDYPFL